MPDPSPRSSTPPVPIHRRPITAREVINAVVVLLSAAAMIAVQFPQTPLPAGVTPAQVMTTAGAFLAGALLPGSPIGRGLDWVASFFGGPQVSFTLADAQAAKDAIAPAPAPPQRIPPSREGRAEIRAMVFVFLAALFGLAGCALLLPGCGASALSQHGSGVAIAMVALRGAEDLELADQQRIESACTTEVCITQARADHRPAEAALDVVRTAVLAWRDAVQVAIDATADNPDVIGALETAAARVLARWSELVAALHPLGVELPALPPAIAGLIGASS